MLKLLSRTISALLAYINRLIPDPPKLKSAEPPTINVLASRVTPNEAELIRVAEETARAIAVAWSCRFLLS